VLDVGKMKIDENINISMNNLENIEIRENYNPDEHENEYIQDNNDDNLDQETNDNNLNENVYDDISLRSINTDSINDNDDEDLIL
jgi:hypothetical protein